MAAEPKSIILCFDGTTKEFNTKNTNIVKLHSMFSKDYPSKQACYYQPGIGQYFEPGAYPLFFSRTAQSLDWAFAWYLYQHVIDGYQFLADNWVEGDQIFIFGFSRGAYVARCVAGMVEKIGLIARRNIRLLGFGYNLYTRTDKEGILLSSAFKRSFARDVKIEFVGVFDTVSSVGWIIQRELPYTSVNKGVKTFRHALSLDERRFRFEPSPWGGLVPFSPQSFLTSPAIPIPAAVTDLFSLAWWKITHPSELFGSQAAHDKAHGSRIDLNEILSAGVPAAAARKLLDEASRPFAPVSTTRHSNLPTNVREVWFAGCHEDIGGGAVSDAAPRSLSDITLRWMVRELLALKAPIIWVSGSVEALMGGGVDLSERPLSSPAELDAQDALAPIHDDLMVRIPILNVKVPLGPWWLFEVLPLSQTWEDGNGRWFRQWRVNLGRGRTIKGTPKVHHSVRQRMDDPALRYKPRANLSGPPEWV